MIKAIKRLITITSPFMIGWMWYCFFNSELLTPEMLIGFIIYLFIILPWWASDSVESYDWDDNSIDDIYDPMYSYRTDNIFYHTNHD